MEPDPYNLFDDLAKTSVVVTGIKTSIWRFGTSTANNSLGAPVAYTYRFHGVFAVVAALLGRQNTFTVAKHRAILIKRKWPALLDQQVGGTPLYR